MYVHLRTQAHTGTQTYTHIKLLIICLWFMIYLNFRKPTRRIVDVYYACKPMSE